MPSKERLTRRERIVNALRRQKGNAWGGFTYVPDSGSAVQLPNVKPEKIKAEEDEGWELIGSVLPYEES